MKKIKILLGFLVFIVIALAVISFFLPSQYRVERSIVMNARAKVVYPYINTLNRWPSWTAWTKDRDASVVYSFEGPEKGVGAVYKWTSEKMGNGRLEITDSDSKTGIAFDLTFDDEKYLAKGGIALAETENTTQVTWSVGGDLGINPIDRYFGLFMDQLMGRDLEEGLRTLKRIVEATN